MGHGERRAEVATGGERGIPRGPRLGVGRGKRKRLAGALGYGGERKQAARGKRAGPLGPEAEKGKASSFFFFSKHFPNSFSKAIQIILNFRQSHTFQ